MDPFLEELRHRTLRPLLDYAERTTGVRALPPVPGVDWETHVRHIVEWLYVGLLWAQKPEAIACFHRYHAPMIRRWLVQHGIPQTDLDDAFGEFLLRVFPFKPSTSGAMMDYVGVIADRIKRRDLTGESDWRGTLNGFLHSCARQFAQGWMRRSRAHGVPRCDPRIVLMGDLEGDASDDPDPSRDGDRAAMAPADESTDLGQQAAMDLDVRTALDRLPARVRQIVELKYFDQLTEREIAQRLGLSVTAVKKALLRARARLRGYLAGYA